MSNKRKNLYINSVNRTRGSPSDFSIKLNYGVCFDKCKLQSLNMFNTFYNITLKNNTLLINGNVRNIQAGNYTLSELISALTFVLSTDNLNTILYDTSNSKLFITFTVSTRLSFGDNSINQVIGFDSTYDVDTFNHVSIAPPNLSTDIFIELSEVNSNQMSNNNFSSYNFVVSNNANKGGIITHTEKTNYLLSSCPQSIKKEIYNIDIKVKNYQGEILQGCSEWTMLLKL